MVNILPHPVGNAAMFLTTTNSGKFEFGTEIGQGGVVGEPYVDDRNDLIVDGFDFVLGDGLIRLRLGFLRTDPRPYIGLAQVFADEKSRDALIR